MAVLKLRAIDDGVGATFPAEILARLKLGAGDELTITETPDGLLLEAADAEFEQQMAVARQVMHDHAGVLRELAK